MSSSNDCISIYSHPHKLIASPSRSSHRHAVPYTNIKREDLFVASLAGHPIEFRSAEAPRLWGFEIMVISKIARPRGTPIFHTSFWVERMPKHGLST